MGGAVQKLLSQLKTASTLKAQSLTSEFADTFQAILAFTAIIVAFIVIAQYTYNVYSTTPKVTIIENQHPVNDNY
jgi:hypothetical protein